MNQPSPEHSPTPSTFDIGGDLTVRRLGFGTMQLTGPGVWGPPADPDGAIGVLRRAVELGVNLIDTADAYGPFVTDGLIREALHPYADDIVIATKVGLSRPGPGLIKSLGRPEYLRQQAELNLRHLGLERLDLLQLHRIDPEVPLEDQVGELKALQDEGKVRHIGLSDVTVDQVEAARAVAPIVSVQNLYNLSDRSSHPLLSHCEAEGIAFIPFFPLATGTLTGEESPVVELAATHGVTPSQLALAWLLQRSPVVLPIPGTKSLTHLEENMAASDLVLAPEDVTALDAVA